MGFFSRKEKKTENKDALNVENIESNSEVFEKKIETSKKTEKKSFFNTGKKDKKEKKNKADKKLKNTRNSKNDLSEIDELLNGSDEDKKTAFETLSLLAEKNSNEALCKLGSLYEKGKSVGINPRKAFDYYQQAAINGDLSAEYKIATYYEQGFGVKQSFEEAMIWYNKSANENYSNSQYKIGFINYYGIHMKEPNYATAFMWLEKASDNNNGKAQNLLGMLYNSNCLMSPNSKKAVECFKKAIDNNTPNAFYNYGQMFEKGIAVTKDEKEAIRLYARGAELGDIQCQLALANAYRIGSILKIDYEKSFYWYNQAAEKKNIEAMRHVAYAYEMGQGVKASLFDALEYYTKASEMGDKESKEKLEELKKTNAFSTYMKELNSLIGMKKLKEDVNGLINIQKMQIMREKSGLKTTDISKHLVFAGNPGTGKTTVARILGSAYHDIGVLSKGQVVEVDKADLVGENPGETTTKTKRKINEALGGILFIDEAYSLANSSRGQELGQEAVDTILKAMEDNREDFVVIVAGYPDEMKRFLNSNPGLKSRFSKYFYFDDYNEEELFEIFLYLCENSDYMLTDGAKECVKAYISKLVGHKEKNFGNGRDIRNYFDKVIERQANRLSQMDYVTKENLTLLTTDDVGFEATDSDIAKETLIGENSSLYKALKNIK